MRTTPLPFAVIGWAVIAQAALAQQPVPIRPLGPVLATAANPFGGVTSVRQLSNGSVLVNDGSNRRLLLFDSTLSHVTVVADSAGGAATAYGARSGGLMPYLADSSLFVGGVAISLLVIDPSGKIVRTPSLPRPSDINFLTSTLYGASFDGRGSLVYRTQPPARVITGPDGNPMLAPQPDSVRIVRVNLATRTPDTAAWFRIPRGAPVRSVRSTDGKTVTNYIPMAPYKGADDWTMTADGSIAIIYAQDFHVEWITTTGPRTVSPRVAFPWKRLADDDKAQVIDSLQAQATRFMRSNDSAAACRPVQPGAIVGKIAYEVVGVGEVPDYLPAFRSGSAKGDADGNIWVAEYVAPAGILGTVIDPNMGQVYDVIDRKGVLVDRVRLPGRANLAGFGPGVAYLSVRDTLPKFPPPPLPPDPVTGCRPPSPPILASQLPPFRLLRARIH